MLWVTLRFLMLSVDLLIFAREEFPLLVLPLSPDCSHLLFYSVPPQWQRQKPASATCTQHERIRKFRSLQKVCGLSQLCFTARSSFVIDYDTLGCLPRPSNSQTPETTITLAVN